VKSKLKRWEGSISSPKGGLLPGGQWGRTKGENTSSQGECGRQAKRGGVKSYCEKTRDGGTQVRRGKKKKRRSFTRPTIEAGYKRHSKVMAS